MSSNIIKGFKQNYDSANFRKLDMTVREERLAEKIEDLKGGNSAFVSGLIPAEVMDGEEFTDQQEGVIHEQNAEDFSMNSFSKAVNNSQDIERLREEIRQELYAEVRIQAEADFREHLQGEVDGILKNAQEEAAQLLSDATAKATAEAEAIKAGIISVASAEGYESGLKKAKEEQAAALRSLEEEKRRVTEEYERQVELLEPAFVEILKEYVKKITGIAYDHHTEILTYLLDQAIRKAPGQNEFIVKLSPLDMERYAHIIPEVTGKYSDKISLTFATSSDVNDGEVRLENEGRILTSSIGLNMDGLIECLDMLSSAN